MPSRRPLPVVVQHPPNTTNNNKKKPRQTTSSHRRSASSSSENNNQNNNNNANSNNNSNNNNQTTTTSSPSSLTPSNIQMNEIGASNNNNDNNNNNLEATKTEEEEGNNSSTSFDPLGTDTRSIVELANSSRGGKSQDFSQTHRKEVPFITSLKQAAKWWEIAVAVVILCLIPGISFLSAWGLKSARDREVAEITRSAIQRSLSRISNDFSSVNSVTRSFATLYFGAMNESSLPNHTAIPKSLRQTYLIQDKFEEYAVEEMRRAPSVISFSTRPANILTQIYPNGTSPFGLDMNEFVGPEIAAANTQRNGYIAGPRILQQGFWGLVTYWPIWLRTTDSGNTALAIDEEYFGTVGVVVNLTRFVEDLDVRKNVLETLSGTAAASTARVGVNMYNEETTNQSSFGDLNVIAEYKGSGDTASTISGTTTIAGVRATVYVAPNAPLLTAAETAVGICMFVGLLLLWLFVFRLLALSRISSRKTKNCDNAPPSGTVTMMSCSIADVCEYWAKQDADKMKTTINVYCAIVRAVIADFGGYEVSCDGDNFLIVSSDLARAVKMSIAIHEAMAECTAWPLKLFNRTVGLMNRIAIITAEAHVIEDKLTGFPLYQGYAIEQVRALEPLCRAGCTIMRCDQFELVPESLQEWLSHTDFFFTANKGRPSARRRVLLPGEKKGVDVAQFTLSAHLNVIVPLHVLPLQNQDNEYEYEEVFDADEVASNASSRQSRASSSNAANNSNNNNNNNNNKSATNSRGRSTRDENKIDNRKSTENIRSTTTNTAASSPPPKFILPTSTTGAPVSPNSSHQHQHQHQRQQIISPAASLSQDQIKDIVLQHLLQQQQQQIVTLSRNQGDDQNRSGGAASSQALLSPSPSNHRAKKNKNSQSTNDDDDATKTIQNLLNRAAQNSTLDRSVDVPAQNFMSYHCNTNNNNNNNNSSNNPAGASSSYSGVMRRSGEQFLVPYQLQQQQQQQQHASTSLVPSAAPAAAAAASSSTSDRLQQQQIFVIDRRTSTQQKKFVIASSSDPPGVSSEMILLENNDDENNNEHNNNIVSEKRAQEAGSFTSTKREREAATTRDTVNSHRTLDYKHQQMIFDDIARPRVVSSTEHNNSSTYIAPHHDTSSYMNNVMHAVPGNRTIDAEESDDDAASDNYSDTSAHHRRRFPRGGRTTPTTSRNSSKNKKNQGKKNRTTRSLVDEKQQYQTSSRFGYSSGGTGKNRNGMQPQREDSDMNNDDSQQQQQYEVIEGFFDSKVAPSEGFDFPDPNSIGDVGVPPRRQFAGTPLSEVDTNDEAGEAYGDDGYGSSNLRFGERRSESVNYNHTSRSGSQSLNNNHHITTNSGNGSAAGGEDDDGEKYRPSNDTYNNSDDDDYNDDDDDDNQDHDHHQQPPDDAAVPSYIMVNIPNIGTVLVQQQQQTQQQVMPALPDSRHHVHNHQQQPRGRSSEKRRIKKSKKKRK